MNLAHHWLGYVYSNFHLEIMYVRKVISMKARSPVIMDHWVYT